MNIDTMPAGNEMNELIAEYVLGMEHLTGDQVPIEHFDSGARGEQEIWLKKNKDGSFSRYCKWCGDMPSWSEYGDGIIDLIEQFNVSIINSEDGYYAVITTDIIHTCDYMPNKAKEIHGKYWALADTMRLAVCRVILKSVMD